MKLHLCFAGIMLLVVIAPTTAAETETERLKQAQELFQPLPRDMAMPDAPITPERVDLGRMLFFDKILSGNRDVACATCHSPLTASGDGQSLAVGTAATIVAASAQPIGVGWSRGPMTPRLSAPRAPFLRAARDQDERSRSEAEPLPGAVPRSRRSSFRPFRYPHANTSAIAIR